jgi:hypothetical protein
VRIWRELTRIIHIHIAVWDAPTPTRARSGRDLPGPCVVSKIRPWSQSLVPTPIHTRTYRDAYTSCMRFRRAKAPPLCFLRAQRSSSGKLSGNLSQRHPFLGIALSHLPAELTAKSRRLYLFISHAKSCDSFFFFEKPGCFEVRSARPQTFQRHPGQDRVCVLQGFQERELSCAEREEGRTRKRIAGMWMSLLRGIFQIRSHPMLNINGYGTGVNV